MKCLVLVLITVGCAASSLLGCAGTTCRTLVVRSQVKATQGELSLADLLAPGTCALWYRWAAQVSLGAVPRAGSARVLEGNEIRRLLRGIGDRGRNTAGDDQQRIPERIVVRQARAVKSCAEIAKVISAADPAQAARGGRELKGKDTDRDKEKDTDKDLDCSAARNVPQDSSLELVKAKWNAGLQRQEFALRCEHPEDCIPFLVWRRADTGAAESDQSSLFSRNRGGANSEGKEAVPLIKTGQTAMLTWDEAGIRVVLPVTCLDAGGLGQRVRVRFKNAPRTLRAEIVGAGMVRASL